MGRQRALLLLILALVLASLYVVFDQRTFPTLLGLDLRGGSQLTIQVKPTAEIKKITSQQLDDVQKVIEGRINGLGVSEPLVQTAGEDQILVQLPGVSDPQQAERVLGGTAQLDFRAQRQGTEGQFLAEQQVRRSYLAKQAELRKSNDQAAIEANQAALNKSDKAIAELFEPPALVGKNLKNAYPEGTPNSNAFSVGLQFDDEGGQKFAELTKKLAGTGRSLGIFLDNRLISAPIVDVQFAQTGITGGGATITGNFSAQEATDLAVQLRGGALPVPVEIVENRTVGATLGRDSIQSSIYAGLGGLALVFVFMVVYYRLPGVIASIALALYALFTYAAFKLLGVTLTLPGIAGFILSIGMAVDANVLIFERTREELRAGKTLYRSVEAGFFRAFSSILDSNVTTLFACGALFFLGAGLVRGFALTLALGVVISMFTAITCSRTLLLYVLTIQGLRKPDWFCPNLPKVNSSTSEAAS
jgi:preprotein translocase subunit SecD